jgi:hypothetical protein
VSRSVKQFIFISRNVISLILFFSVPEDAVQQIVPEGVIRQLGKGVLLTLK